MNRKGFTLTELIGVIVIIAIILGLAVVSFVGIRNSVLEKQYDNLVTYIASKAASYSEETGELNVTIERLIETGFVEADADNIIKDPRNNNNINCYMFNSKYESGNYNATLGNDIGINEDGKCNKYEVLKEMQICVVENGVCNTAIASWYNKNITLSVLIGNNPELINNAEVVWRVNGEVINSKTYETNISSINKGIYYVDIKYEELKPDGTNKVIQGTESAAINIDLEKPVVKSIEINKETQWTNSNKKTTVKMSDNNGSGISGLAIVVGTKHCSEVGAGELNIQMEDTYNTELDIGSYNVCVLDLAGNVSEDNYFEIKKVDKIAPTCEVSASPMPDGENNWYISKPISINLTYTDNIEENIAHGMRLNNATAYYNNEESINHISDTSNAIYYGYVKDIAGNENTCNKEIKLDTINPSCNIKVTGDKEINGSEWYTSNVTIELEETKGTSNISKHDLSTSTEVSYKNENVNITKTQSDTTGITYYGYVKGESGREGSCNKTNIKVDTINPSIGSITTEETGTSGTINIKTTISDNGSKLAGYAVTNSNSVPTNWTNISGAPNSYEIIQTVNSSGTYYIWAKDIAGNITSSESNIVVSYVQTTQVRYENADGTWGSYATVETKSVNYGEQYSWSTSQISNFDSTTYQSANVTAYTVTGTKTNQVSIYRKTFTCKIGYKLQKADGTYDNAVNAVNSTLRYGDTCSYSRAADTTYKAASYSTVITANVNQTINVERKEVTCTKEYRLQNADGTWGSYIADGSTTALYGGTCSYTKSVTNYKGASGDTNNSVGTASATNVTSNQTLRISMYRNTFVCSKQYRLENADGTWGSYTADGNETALYGGTCSYTKSVTNYKGSASGANGSAGTASASNVTSAQTLSISMYRNTLTCKIGYKLQNADGTYGSVTNAVNSTLRYGSTCSYSRAADATYKAASYSTALTANVDQTVNVDRNTFTITKRYRQQGTDGTYPSSYTADGTATVRYGDSYTYTKSATTTHQAASTTASNVTANATLSLDVPRKTFTITKRYRLQNVDGTYPSNYTADGTETVVYGGSYTYSKSATTTHQSASASASNVTANATLSLDVPRKTYTCKIGYKLQNADGTYGSVTNVVNSTLRYGETCSWSRSADATYKAASYSSTITANIDQTVSVDRNTYTCTKRYRLQNADGTWGNYTTDGTTTALYGSSCSYTKSVTNYKGSASGANGSAGTASATNIMSNQTLSISMYRNTFTCSQRYRLQNADGTWGSYTADGSATALYGGSCSYTKSVTNYRGSSSGDNGSSGTASASNVTAAQTLSLDFYRNTFTITKRYRLQGTDAAYPSSYTADGTVTALYGSSYTYSKSATTTHQAASTTASNVTANATLSLDVPRKTFTCSKQYRLENADGTWGSYTTDGSVTAVYGGSCSYSKTVTDYKGSSGGTNGSAGTASVTNVTSNQTLSVSMYRNTYTLTVTASTNTSSATGGGTKRWGQSCTVGVTKATNTTCVTYATPTWTASTGTAPAAGASSTYTMPKSNATVTATSAASNAAQTITLSKGTGVSGISIGGTNYTGTSASLTCGTYNISGSFAAGYSFSSWARANGVAVTSTSTASTTMTVSGAGTLTLNSKANTYNLVITGDEGVSAFSVKVGSTSGTSISCTKSGNNYTCSNLSNGTSYYLYPTFNSGFSFGSYAKTDSATNAQLGSTSTQNTYYKMGAGAGAITINSKVGLCEDLDHCMQTATMENCGNTKKDARDGKSYTTAIIGTQCWMTKNLSLAGGTALTSVLSNVASSYTIPASDCNASYGSDPTGTFMCNDQWGKGAYYSWNIAVAGSASVPTYGPQNPPPSDLSYDNVAPYDICPKRWKLPTSFSQVARAVSEREDGHTYYSPTSSPFYGELNGHPLYSGQDRIGDFGFLWSSSYAPRVYVCEAVNGQAGCGYSGGIDSLYIRSNSFEILSVTSGHAKGIRCILKDN